MKAPKLIVLRSNESDKTRRYKEHIILCEQCRDAITEIDLCLEGLELFLDRLGIAALQQYAEKLKS